MLGSLPSGIWISRALGGKDPRMMGSGSSGATNVARQLGKWGFTLVFLADALKGMLAVFLCLSLPHLIFSESVLALLGLPLQIHGQSMSGFDALPWMGLFAAMLGHVYTPLASFKGGKGVATAAGGLCVLVPMPCLGCLLVFLIVGLSFKRMFLASLSAALSLPFWAFLFAKSDALHLYFTLMIPAFLLWTHRRNIALWLRAER
jgi:acyl phosphate:glycerol-3-phosphate acyltransferase